MSIHFNPITIVTVIQGTIHISHSSTLPSHTLIKRESCIVLEFSFGKKEKKEESEDEENNNLFVLIFFFFLGG